MRKYIIGTIFGLVLGLSATAYADNIQNLIGQKIQGQTAVYLDGTKLDTAIIVDGKSYTPTRKLAESAGKKVSFIEGGIYLETPKNEVPEIIDDTNMAPKDQEYNADLIESKIKSLTLMKESCLGTIDLYQKDMGISDSEKAEVVKNLNSKLAEIQTELDLWNQRKAELQK